MEIQLLRQPHKFIRKAKSPLKKAIIEELDRIAKNPKIGKLLVGKLKLIRSHKFTSAGVHYRVAYMVKKNVLVILIASRENFYRDLRI
ncbi:type II toxin-antitoxin system RelE/ParE family toxin [Candidatus Uhrbacteria bacterium]|nr:type II toxin-antitoxin system RelE/ParE family toxin [Candidatus Uhrbacteria bacterium]